VLGAIGAADVTGVAGLEIFAERLLCAMKLNPFESYGFRIADLKL
jgi:hypothetical protein